MKRLLTVTAFTAMLTLFRMLAGFAVAKIVAIYTGPAGMAMLGQVQNMVVAFNGIVNAPSGNCIVRYTAENHHQGFYKCSEWWRASLHWILLFISIISPVTIFLSKTISQILFETSDYSWIVIVSTIMLPFVAFGNLIIAITNGQQQYRRFVTLGFISVFVSSCLMICFIIYNNLHGALLAAAMQGGLIGIVVVFLTIGQPWLKIKFWWGKTDLKKYRLVGGYILMAITSALLVPISLVIIRNIIVSELGWSSAGAWQAVWKISETYLSVLTMALSTYFLPKLSSLNKAEDIRNEINKTAKVVVPIAVCMALSIYFSRDIIIKLLFTPEFNSSRDLFFLQLIGDIIKITSWLYAYPLLSRGVTRWFIGSEITFSLIFVFLGHVLIPIYGLFGANIAYAGTYLFYLIFILLLKPEKR